jgi:hypothetical protein
MNDYQNLPYNQTVFKSSHNSYDRDEQPLGKQLNFHNDPATYYNCGCRGLELDIWRHTQSDPNSPDWFTVNHLTNGGENFSYYLSQLQDWHKSNPGHDVVWVSLDVKSSMGDESTFPDELDRYLTNFMGRDLILTPGDLFQGINGNNLSELVKQQGWPLLGTLTDKFIFCLSGEEDWKKTYSETAPATRFCLADATDASKLLVPNGRVVYNVKTGKGSQDDIKRLKNNNNLIRIYDTDSQKDWQNSLQIGGNILATNEVSDHTWAAVSTQSPYSPFESSK